MTPKTEPSRVALAARVAALMNAADARLVPVAGNWGLTVYRAEMENGRAAVKAGRAQLEGHLETEARMLGDLAAAGLPVPEVHALEPDILVMEWIEHDALMPRPVHERAAGEMLAALHDRPQRAHGYGYPTQIGSIAQPNEAAPTWTGFFRDRRLLHYTSLAARAGLIEGRLAARLECLAGRLGTFIDEPVRPSLLHGDVWTGNVLLSGPRLAAFVDPAIFRGDAEYELAYVTLHGTFGRAFFEAYGARRPIAPEFEAVRRDLYLVVPLLQHVILSGPVYAHRIVRILDRLGV